MCVLYALTWATRAHNTGVTCIQICVLNYVGMYLTARVPHCAIMGCLVWTEGEKRQVHEMMCLLPRACKHSLTVFDPRFPLFCAPHVGTENANFWHQFVQTNNTWCASLVFWMLFWQRTREEIQTWKHCFNITLCKNTCLLYGRKCIGGICSTEHDQQSDQSRCYSYPELLCDKHMVL